MKVWLGLFLFDFFLSFSIGLSYPGFSIAVPVLTKDEGEKKKGKKKKKKKEWSGITSLVLCLHGSIDRLLCFYIFTSLLHLSPSKLRTCVIFYFCFFPHLFSMSFPMLSLFVFFPYLHVYALFKFLQCFHCMAWFRSLIDWESFG